MAPVWLLQPVEFTLAENLGEVELRREPAAHSVVRPLSELQVAEGGRPIPLEDDENLDRKMWLYRESKSDIWKERNCEFPSLGTFEVDYVYIPPAAPGIS